MEFSIKSGAPQSARNGCLVVGVFEPRKLSRAGAALDRAAKGSISTILRRGDMQGKLGKTLFLHNVPGAAADRVLLVGLGREAQFSEKQYRSAVVAAIRALGASGAEEASLHLTELALGKRDAAWKVAHAVMVARECTYRFTRMKSKREDNDFALRRLVLSVNDRTAERRAAAGLEHGLAVAHGVALARDLGNLPPNVCTPAYLADQARELAKRYRMKVEVMERADMERLGMGALLSVARGSAQPPKFITLEHRGGPKTARPVALVGKGVTFDTGGISIKPSAEMDQMKFDMCGAASVLGTMKAVGEMRLPVNVVGVIPATENMPGGRATRPGDIVKSLSRQTVEILNTDAEGRLILCDALTYVERFKPAAVIDIATLTGACVVALGHVATGLFANDDTLASEVLGAGVAAHDRAWRLPLWEDYQEQLSSNFADFANVGGRPAGAVTAACFLARFTKSYKWAHLDIAGTAWKSGKEKGGTGRPVPLLTQFLINRARGSRKS
ncbi:MAG: leucyl aminopeptidase [Betaproteobacteria bacterium]|nr:leucyl aminopeptidase [Betaproteobacteria bacterium]MDH3436115.1 leucyl aminopeptidase [Betaproteobacteria bacterium]